MNDFDKEKLLAELVTIKPERDNNHTKSEINHSYKNFHILKRYYTKKGFYYKESKSPFRFLASLVTFSN